ncbi:MAG: hypothetical protein COA45_00090 [Zetaproteobacteria bacterium]|nr:MAG: hypothetical protein COA45_00090 [Zetaproteobacteria bacterium]
MIWQRLTGLAIRKSTYIKQPIIKELQGDFHGTWAIKAAEVSADPNFMSILKKLKVTQHGKIPEYMMSCIDDAIDACLAAEKSGE